MTPRGKKPKPVFEINERNHSSNRASFHQRKNRIYLATMFDYFANPSRFMRIANRLLLRCRYQPDTGAIGLVWSILLPPIISKAIQFASSTFMFHQRQAGPVRRYRGLGLYDAFLCCLAAPACRYSGNCPGMGQFLPLTLDPRRRVVGKTDVGCMVGLGCPPDLNVNPVLFLSWLYRLGQQV